MIQFDRYRVFAWDEFLRLWCEDCYTEGEELGMWAEDDPVSVAEIVALCAVHELAEHSDSDGHHPLVSPTEGDPPRD